MTVTATEPVVEDHLRDAEATAKAALVLVDVVLNELVLAVREQGDDPRLNRYMQLHYRARQPLAKIAGVP